MAQTLTFPRHETQAAPRLSLVVSQWLRTWAKDIFDPYRPEQHYMRGPGPKWHAKHGTPARISTGI